MVQVITDAAEVSRWMSAPAATIGDRRQFAGGGYRADASTTFLPQDLEHIESEMLANEYEQHDGGLIVPRYSNVARGTSVIVAYTSQAGGRPVAAVPGLTLIPNVAVGRERETWNFQRYVIGATWTDQDVLEARLHGVPVSGEVAIAAIEAHDQLADDIIFDGDTVHGLGGLYDDKNVITTVSGTPFDSTSTPKEISAAIHAAIHLIADQTGSVEKPNRIAMSSTKYDYCKTTKMSADSSVNILDSVVSDSGFIGSVNDIHRVPRLNSVEKFDDTAVMIVYRFDPKKLKQALIAPAATGPLARLGLEYCQLYDMYLSGVQYRRAKSVHITHGI